MAPAISIESFEEQLPGFLINLSRQPNVQNPLVKHHPGSPSTLQFTTTVSENLQYVIMVTYHSSYLTPVVYFRTCRRVDDGWMLAYDCSSVRSHCSIEEFRGSNWAFIHPCDTDELIQNGSLVSWASIYLQPLLPLVSTAWM